MFNLSYIIGQSLSCLTIKKMYVCNATISISEKKVLNITESEPTYLKTEQKPNQNRPNNHTPNAFGNMDMVTRWCSGRALDS